MAEKKGLELQKENKELKDLLNLTKDKLQKLQNDSLSMAGKTYLREFFPSIILK